MVSVQLSPPVKSVSGLRVKTGSASLTAALWLPEVAQLSVNHRSVRVTG